MEVGFDYLRFGLILFRASHLLNNLQLIKLFSSYYLFSRAPLKAMGSTVSAPVYDNSKSPPLFLGVVGIDFTLDALDAALGINDTSSNESFQRVVKRSSARCPRLELTACELESYRRQSNTVGDDALCNADCAEEDFVQVTEEKCPGVSDYPGDLWINLSNKGVAYSERACCRVAAPVVEPDPTCTAPPTPEPTEPPIEDESETPIALIVGPAVGGCVLLTAAVVFYLQCCKKEKSERSAVHATPMADVTVPNHDDESTPSQPGEIIHCHLNRDYTASVEPRLTEQQQRSESERMLSPVSRPDVISPARQDSGTVVAEAISGSMGTLQNVELFGDGPEYKDQCRPLDDPRQSSTSDAGDNSSSLRGFTNTGGSNDEADSSAPNSETCSAAPTSGENKNVAATVEIPLAAVPAPAPAPTSAPLPVEAASPMIGPTSHIPATSNDGGDPGDDVVAFRLDG